MAEVTIKTEETPSSELEVSEEAAEAIEVVSDNEVTIAAIEADKEIQIEEIRAEARVAEAEAYAEISSDNSDDERWEILNRLASTLEGVENRLQLLEQTQTSLVSAEILETANLEEVAEVMSDLTPLSTSAPTSETQTEVIEKSEGESPEVIIPPVLEVSGKPIIRLV